MTITIGLWVFPTIISIYCVIKAYSSTVENEWGILDAMIYAIPFLLAWAVYFGIHFFIQLAG